MRRLTLKPRREGPVRGGHPWIFSGAIAAGLEGAEPGEPVAVHAAGGRFLAAGYCNPQTPITVRVLTHEEEAIDAALVRRRLDEALALRQATLPAGLDAYRVLNGEGDRLPGVVVDRYGDFLVCQFLTAGAARLAPAVVEGLGERLAPRGIFERSEGAVRTEEGLAGARGALAGEEPPARLRIAEDGACFLVDVLHGQRTGFFLAEEAWAANGLPAARGRFVVADVFEFLREGSEPYDLIVLDPPPFVRRRRDLAPGLRGYKDVNLQALRRLAPGGWLLTSSCSQHLTRAGFREVVAAAAADAGRVAEMVAEWGHPPDHPVLLAHPEGEYLKVMLLRA